MSRCSRCTPSEMVQEMLPALAETASRIEVYFKLE
jgi:hypothetical protein